MQLLCKLCVPVAGQDTETQSLKIKVSGHEGCDHASCVLRNVFVAKHHVWEDVSGCSAAKE